jgi:hypothetical protein
VPFRVQISENENTTETFKEDLTKFYEMYRRRGSFYDFFSFFICYYEKLAEKITK